MNYDKSTVKRLRNFLINQGLTIEGVYGLLANIYSESGFRSNNAQNSYMNKMGITDEIYTAQVDSGEYVNFVFDRVGYGLCQWTSSGRKQNLINYAKQCCKSIGDEDMQLNFLMQELNGSYKAVLNVLKTSHDISYCAKYVMTKFERPADQSETAQNKRANYGIQLFNEVEDIKKEETTMSKPVIAISAGHGLYTVGKRCMKALDPNETREWFLNDRIADKVEQKLGAYNCKVIRVNDTTGKTDTALSTRTTISNTANADIYLAIHHNAGVNGGSGGGTVVFYYPTGNNKDIATRLYNHVISCTGLKGNRSKAIASTTSLYEVRKPKAKSLLIENGFMDSTIDVPIILTEEHAEKTANGIVNFFVEYFKLTKSGAVVAPTTPTSSTTLYRVRKSWDKPSTQVGAFSSLEKAKSVCKSGYYVFDENGNVLYPVVNNTSSIYTHKDFVKEVQAAVGAKVDGIAGSETLSKTVTVSKIKNRKHAVVKPIQKYLNSQGYNAGTADGVAGAKFDIALKAFQKANGCVVDGEATAQKSTWEKLLKL